MDTLSTPFSHPLYVMAKPAGALCNLQCTYCYYLEKKHLYEEGSPMLMSDEILERFIKQYMEAQTQTDVLFTWHGGEPLLRPIAFYEKAMRLQQHYGRGFRICNSIQTNGTLLNDEWCRFFRDNGWLVGISIDGPQPFHDAYRLSRNGQPSFREVIRGIELLNRYGVEWNAMAVVSSSNVGHPLEFYRFFRDIGCRYLQFTPIVERRKAHADGRQLASPAESGLALTEESVSPEAWGRFLCAIFSEWVRRDVGRIFVELFDCTLANWCGLSPGICTFARDCGHAGVMEHNGDVYSCDHFVFPQYKLGNIREHTLFELLHGPRQLAFSRMKSASLPRQCRECRFRFACQGECPKNRFCLTADGEPGLNYLCEGYRAFFEHAAPCMDFMKSEFDHQRPPANVMQALAEGLL